VEYSTKRLIPISFILYQILLKSIVLSTRITEVGTYDTYVVTIPKIIITYRCKNKIVYIHSTDNIIYKHTLKKPRFYIKIVCLIKINFQ